MSRCRLYNENADKIERYCNTNGLDFEKLKQMSKCWGKNDIVFQYHDPEKGKMGLLDETPMPVVLIVRQTQNELVFEQTEHTKKYLS